MSEKRHAKRCQLFSYLRVTDAETGELIGHVVDITTEGMLLISEHAIQKGVVFTLKMEVPASDGSVSEVALRAQSRWSTSDVNKSFYDTGFRLVNPTEDVIATIRRVIAELDRTVVDGEVGIEERRASMARMSAR